MILNSPYITGSLTVTGNSVFDGSITVAGGISGSSAVSASYALSASFASNAATATSASFASNAATATSASQAQNAVSSSFASNAATATSASFASNAATATSASQAQNAVSSSFAANANLLDGKDSTEFAITGSNIFTGIQYNTDNSNPNGFGASASIYTDGGVRITKDAYVSGTMFVNNLTVFGTQSINYITSSQLNISTNIISVNTDTPSIRFGGLSVYDSGSTGLTGSMLWDSERDHWVYSNPSGSSYNSGMMISGPRNSGSLGTEQGTLNNVIVKGQGGDHVTSSQMIDDGTTVRIPGNFQVTGSVVLSSTLTGTSANLSGNIVLNRPSTSAGNNIEWRTANTLNWYIGTRGLVDNNFYFVNEGLGSNNLILNASTGAATFSSSVTATNLSINTTTSDGRIDVRPNGLSSFPIFWRNNNGGYGGGVYVTGGNNMQLYLANSAGTENVLIAANGNSYFNGGNVGIGTTSPSTPLHVSGSASQIVRITTSGALSTGFYDAFQMLATNQTGGGLSLNIGKAESQNDLAKMVYFHTSNGSTSNRLGFGFFNNDSLFNILASSNIGIGTIPSAWGTVFTRSAIQFGGSVGVGALWTNSFNNGVFLGNNLYDDGAGSARYIVNGTSTQYVQAGGEHYWSNAASGTAGNVATFAERLRITSTGIIQPGANGTQDLGTASLRWATVFTSDLSMSNGIGDYTIVEGEEDLFLYNNKTNKVFKFVLAEVDPSIAPPKKS